MRSSYPLKIFMAIISAASLSITPLLSTTAYADCSSLEQDINAVSSEDIGSDLWWINMWMGDIDLAHNLSGGKELWKGQIASDEKNIQNALGKLAKDYAKLTADSISCNNLSAADLSKFKEGLQTLGNISLKNVASSLTFGVTSLPANNLFVSLIKAQNTLDSGSTFIKNYIKDSNGTVFEHVGTALGRGLTQTEITAVLIPQVKKFFPNDKQDSTKLANDMAGFINSAMHRNPVAAYGNYGSMMIDGVNTSMNDVKDVQNTTIAMQWAITMANDSVINSSSPNTVTKFSKQSKLDLDKSIASLNKISNKVILTFNNSPQKTSSVLNQKGILYLPIKDMVDGFNSLRLSSNLSGHTWNLNNFSNQIQPPKLDKGNYSVIVNSRTPIANFTPVQVKSQLYIPLSTISKIVNSLGYQIAFDVQTDTLSISHQ